MGEATLPKLAANRLTSVDALRGLAALGVLVGHAYSFLWMGPREHYQVHPPLSFDPLGWLGWIFMPLRYGVFGVELFFVLSGYCIHRSQAKALAADPDAKSMKIGRFFLRRFFRIYPTYVAALALAGVLRYVVLPYMASKGYALDAEDATSQHSWSNLGITLSAMQNVLPFPSGGTYTPAFPYERIYWTLSLEIHFYLLYPLVLLIIRKFGAANMLVLSLAVGLLWNILYFVPYTSNLPWFFLNLTFFAPYWFTWCLGAYVAEIEAEGCKFRGLTPIAVTAAVIAVGIYLVGHLIKLPDRVMLEYWLEYPVAVVVGAVLLWSLKSSGHRFWRSMPVRVLAFVGVFSFSLYAVHYSMLRVIRAYLGPHHSTVLPALLACAIIIPAAYLFFLLIERWTLRSPEGWFGKRTGASTEVVKKETVCASEGVKPE